MRHPPPAFPVPRAVSCAGPWGLSSIRAPVVNLAIWRRGPRQAAPGALAHAAPFSVRAEGAPRQAARAALRACPAGAPPRARTMLERLAARFAAATGAARIAVRIEALRDDACRKFHADAVGIRLLCTWHGRGTELRPDAPRSARVQRLGVGDVALLKGDAWPGNRGRGAVHRSPPVAHLPRRLRARVLVVMDTLAAD